MHARFFTLVLGIMALILCFDIGAASAQKFYLSPSGSDTKKSSEKEAQTIDRSQSSTLGRVYNFFVPRAERVQAPRLIDSISEMRLGIRELNQEAQRGREALKKDIANVYRENANVNPLIVHPLGRAPRTSEELRQAHGYANTSMRVMTLKEQQLNREAVLRAKAKEVMGTQSKGSAKDIMLKKKVAEIKEEKFRDHIDEMRNLFPQLLFGKLYDRESDAQKADESKGSKSGN